MGSVTRTMGKQTVAVIGAGKWALNSVNVTLVVIVRLHTQDDTQDAD